MKEKTQNLVFDINEDIKFSEAFWEQKDYPLHYHDYFELELVTEGKGSQLFNDEEFSLSKKDLYLLRPTDSHKIHSDNISLRNIKLKSNILPKWILQKLHSFKNPKVFHLTDKEFDKFISLFNLLEDENQFSDKENDTRIKAIEILFSNFIRLGKNDPSLFGDSITSKVAYYICKNNRFTQKISLSEISKYAGYSKYYISSVFHKQYGMTIQDFILAQRIEYAKKLILETDLSIFEIIIESGFVSTSNFYSKFQEYVGCSPLQVRKGLKKQNETIA